MFFSTLVCFAEDVQESMSDADGKCLLAETATNALVAKAYGLTNNGAEYSQKSNIHNFNFRS